MHAMWPSNSKSSNIHVLYPKMQYASYTAWNSISISICALCPEGICAYIYIICLKNHYAGYAADLGIAFEGLRPDYFFTYVFRNTLRMLRGLLKEEQKQ